MWGKCLSKNGWCSNHVLACKRWLQDKWTMKKFHSLFFFVLNKFCQFSTHEIAQSQFLLRNVCSGFRFCSPILPSVCESVSLCVSIWFCSAVFLILFCFDMHQLPCISSMKQYHLIELCLKEPNEQLNNKICTSQMNCSWKFAWEPYVRVYCLFVIKTLQHPQQFVVSILIVLESFWSFRVITWKIVCRCGSVYLFTHVIAHLLIRIATFTYVVSFNFPYIKWQILKSIFIIHKR